MTDDEVHVLARVPTDRGEIVLRRRGADFEIISNGTFLMDTRAGASERLLITAALTADPTATAMLIGGLGVGFSLDEAIRSPTLNRITVVEIEPAIIAWHRTHLRHLGAAALGDPRVRIERADLVRRLAEDPRTYDAICLDIDNGPDWTVVDDNRALYGRDGLTLLNRRLRPGGVLSVWSAAESADFATRLAGVFATVRVHPVPVDRGVPDVVYVARSKMNGKLSDP